MHVFRQVTSVMSIFSASVFLLIFVHITIASEVDPLLFDKESGLNTIFPPVIPAKIDKHIPTGHLRCFGHQSYSLGPIKQIDSLESATDFADIVAEGKPVIIKESSIMSAVISDLSDDDLAAQYGNQQIHYVPIRRHRPKEIILLDSLQSFLSSYRKRDEYLASTVPEPMRHLFPIPSYLQCGPYAKRLIEAEMWMAWGGTGSLLHYHGDHQLHCMVDGRKDFVFFEAKYKKEFKCKETRPHSGEGVSSINMDMINMFEEKQISDIPWTHITALEGQCVYIPATYLHHVRSFGRALAFKIHFAPIDNSTNDDVDCEKNSPKPGNTLADFDFIWTMKNGFEQLANEKLTAESLTHILKVVARGSEELSRDEFSAFFTRALDKTEKDSIEVETLITRVFNYLDKKGRGKLYVSEFKDVESQMGQVAIVLNKIHIPKHTEL